MDSNWLPPDFKEFLQLLNEEKVEYLLVGGWAVGVYGHPRYTADMDVWIALSPRNASHAVRALVRFGFSHGEVSEELLLDQGKIVRMGFAPMRIEILNRIDGVEFEACYGRRNPIEICGVIVPVISLEDLLENKRASNRPKDMADVENLTGGST